MASSWFGQEKIIYHSSRLLFLLELYGIFNIYSIAQGVFHMHDT